MNFGISYDARLERQRKFGKVTFALSESSLTRLRNSFQQKIGTGKIRLTSETEERR